MGGIKMEDRIRELLPIGSVVLLKDAVKRVMIYGVMQTDSETDEDYDYLGVVYPEGSMGDGSSFFFNHEQIDQVFFTDYSDAERESFVEKLEAFYNDQQ